MTDGIQGVFTAIVTPFLDNHEIDWPAFESLLEQQVQGGIHGIVISGTTGESPALTVQEKLSLIKKARAVCGQRCRIMAGTGGNNTVQSVELSRLAKDAGADSLLVVTPYYNKPTLAGLKAHFSRIIEAVDIPVCLYHVPSRTGQFLAVKAITELCEQLRIPAIKEASGDLGFYSRVTYRLPRTAMLSGDDATFLPSMSVGGKGVISVVSNLYPQAMVDLYEAARLGQRDKAIALNKRLLPLMDLSMAETNPGPIKAMMAIKGIIKNKVRPPLSEVTSKTYQKLEAAVHDERELS